MKVLMLSHSDGGGGAGRASYRLLQALGDQGVDVSMHVDFRNTDDPRVVRTGSVARDARRRSRITLEEIPAYVSRFPEPRLFSPGLAGAMSAKEINDCDADVVNLQWINFGYLSIRTIGAITKPLTWNIHDMWAFTGGMNYDSTEPNARWREGFPTRELPGRGQWWDVDRWVWRRKVKHWKRPITLIASSSWMASLAQDSPLTTTWPVHVIPNPIDTALYRPGSMHAARESLGLPSDAELITAFFPKDLHDSRKGFGLFVESLEHLARLTQGSSRSIHVAIAGHNPPASNSDLAGLPTHWLGYLDDARSIQAYQASDVIAVPSRQDNSPQTATEALSCGTPVVAFNATGLPDFVDNGVTGYLAEPFNSEDFARGLDSVLSDQDRRDHMSRNAREVAEVRWSFAAVGSAHRDVFASVSAANPA